MKRLFYVISYNPVIPPGFNGCIIFLFYNPVIPSGFTGGIYFPHSIILSSLRDLMDVLFSFSYQLYRIHSPKILKSAPFFLTLRKAQDDTRSGAYNTLQGEYGNKFITTYPLSFITPSLNHSITKSLNHSSSLSQRNSKDFWFTRSIESVQWVLHEYKQKKSALLCPYNL